MSGLTGTSTKEQIAAAGSGTGGRDRLAALSENEQSLALNPPIDPLVVAGGKSMMKGGLVFHIRRYGALGGAQKVTDAAMANGSAHLTSASALFKLTDVGKQISCANALGATGQGSCGSGTVTAFNSATDVTVSFTCTNGAGVSGVEATWGYDDTPALRAAKVDAEVVGGTVFADADYFVFQPQTTSDQFALTISGNNVTIQGAGRNATHFWFRVYPFKDPKTDWNGTNPNVLRGHGIFVAGGTSGAHQHDIQILDIDLDGDSGYTGNASLPASFATGDGWDTTNKAVFAGNNNYIDRLLIQRCHIHAWRGEIIYGAGALTLTKYEIYDNEIHDSNGDGISVSAEIYIRRNHIYKIAPDGIENSYSTQPAAVVDNFIHDCDLDGISYQTINATEPHGPLFIKHNHLWLCQRSAIAMVSLHNAWVEYNDAEDCAWGNPASYNFYTIQQSGLWGSPTTKNLHLKHNTGFAHVKACGYGLGYNGAISDLDIDDLDFGVTEYGLANGASMAAPVNPTGGTFSGRIHIGTIRGKGTTVSFTDQSEVIEQLLTTTGATDVVQVRPPGLRNYLVYVYLRVITGATVCTVTITWADFSFSVRTFTPISAVSEPVGYVSLAPFFIGGAVGDNASHLIKVTVTAGTANQVYVSAALRECAGGNAGLYAA